MNGSYAGFRVAMANINDYRCLRIMDKNASFDSTPYIEAKDNGFGRRFNSVKLMGVKVGSPLGNFADVDILEDVFDCIMQQHLYPEVN